MMIYHLFGPQRLHPPFDEGWVLLGFFRGSQALAQIHQLPTSFEDEDARRYAGGRAPEHGLPIPLEPAQAAAIASAFKLPVHTEQIRYFLEYETSGVLRRRPAGRVEHRRDTLRAVELIRVSRRGNRPR